MSIPTRFNVITPNKTYNNQSMFTISYGRDLNDRNVWKERFQEHLKYDEGLRDWYECRQLIKSTETIE
jgi:hypothetical protein